jgi:cytochrome c peroxidase
VFSDGLTAANVRTALLEYERSLVTPNAPFDRYLRGDTHAISERAKQGYALFKTYGCASCHQGMAVGGNMLQRVGVMHDYFGDRGSVTPADLGHFSVTHLERDRYVFRVPSLRNVALTAPYFHDGTAATLEKAITTMARYQLGRELEDEDVALLAEFLRTLTGEYRGKPP